MTKARTLADNFAADINGITAGTGITGGGTSGTVTITNEMATTIDAKGDLVVGTGADTFAKLTVGTNGYTLVADSGETTGLKWAAPAGGDVVKISSVTWTAAAAQSLTSVFSATYDSYMIVFDNMQGTAAANAFSWRLRSGANNNTNSTYYWANLGLQVDNTGSNSNGTTADTFSTASLVESPHKCGMVLWMFNPFNSVRTSCVWQTFGNTASNFVYRTGGGFFAADTSFDGLGFFLSGGGNISGNATVYGLKK